MLCALPKHNNAMNTYKIFIGYKLNFRGCRPLDLVPLLISFCYVFPCLRCSCSYTSFFFFFAANTHLINLFRVIQNTASLSWCALTWRECVAICAATTADIGTITHITLSNDGQQSVNKLSYKTLMILAIFPSVVLFSLLHIFRFCVITFFLWFCARRCFCYRAQPFNMFMGRIWYWPALHAHINIPCLYWHPPNEWIYKNSVVWLVGHCWLVCALTRA